MKGKETELVRRHTPLVRRVALQLAARLPASVEVDDLIQAGMLGLVDAIRRYQKMPQAQFETYAVQRVRGAMLDELRKEDWLPRSLRDKGRRISEAMQAAEQRLGRAASEAEIAEQMGLPLSDYHTLLQEAHGAQVVLAEDMGGGDEGGGGLLAQLGSDATNPLGQVLLGDLRRALVEAIGRLPEREQLLLSLLYKEDMNLKEVAMVMAVTEGRVCQLRTQAISRIRSHLQTLAWDERPEMLCDVPVF